MTDVFTHSARSSVMKQVKSARNPSTERKLVTMFKDRGITGWRRNFNLFGKPDFTFPALKLVVFTDGCFWHGHSCPNLKPATNQEYWFAKIEKNKKRDWLVTKTLISMGWRVIRIWECQLKTNNRQLVQKLRIISGK